MVHWFVSVISLQRLIENTGCGIMLVIHWYSIGYIEFKYRTAMLHICIVYIVHICDLKYKILRLRVFQHSSVLDTVIWSTALQCTGLWFTIHWAPSQGQGLSSPWEGPCYGARGLKLPLSIQGLCAAVYYNIASWQVNCSAVWCNTVQ